MSDKFRRVNQHYKNGYWSLRQVWEAVDDGWITEAEYQEITGMVYEREEEK